MQMMIDDPIEGFDIFKALRESKEEGREEGSTENKISNAKKMLSIGIPDKDILFCTGLSSEELEVIKKEIEKK